MPTKITTYTSIFDAPEYKKAATPKSKQYSLPGNFKKSIGIPEREVIKAIKTGLKSLKGCMWRIEANGKIIGNTMISSEMKGLPDLMFLRDGKLYFIECKQFGGHVSMEQLSWLQRAVENGASSVIATSWEGLRLWLEGNSSASEYLEGIPVV